MTVDFPGPAVSPATIRGESAHMEHRPSLGLVFTIVLIDMLGFGIVMPVLPQLIMHLGHLPIDSAAVYAGWLGAGKL